MANHLPNYYTRFTPKKRELFLDALAKTGNVQKAAKSAHTTPKTAYNYRHADPDFAAAWAQALDAAYDIVLEPEAMRRALDGVERPVYHQGKKVDTIREYSDTLLIFLLKGGRPAKYRERYEHSGDPAAPVVMKVVYDPTPQSDPIDVTPQPVLQDGHGPAQ
jgi:hypothetical protein